MSATQLCQVLGKILTPGAVPILTSSGATNCHMHVSESSWETANEETEKSEEGK